MSNTAAPSIVKVEFTNGTGAQYPTNAQVATTPGAAAATPTSAPTLAQTGGTASVHDVYGTVTAAGAATTVTLNTQVAFKSGVYIITLWDATGFAVGGPVTAQAATSFTFTSTAGHVYAYSLRGA